MPTATCRRGGAEGALLCWGGVTTEPASAAKQTILMAATTCRRELLAMLTIVSISNANCDLPPRRRRGGVTLLRGRYHWAAHHLLRRRFSWRQLEYKAAKVRQISRFRCLFQKQRSKIWSSTEKVMQGQGNWMLILVWVKKRGVGSNERALFFGIKRRIVI